MSSFLKVIDIGLRSALFTKFEDILDLSSVNEGVIFYPKEIAFRHISEKRGKSISEFINVWRTRTAPDFKRQRTPTARRGIRVAFANDDETLSTVVKAMPVDLEYNVWFWSKDIENLNLIAERYLFWQQDNPNLNLYYNDDYPAELDLHFGEMVDESDVPTMFDKGTHFVMRVPISIEGWVFTSTSTNTVIRKIELVIYDSLNLTDYRQCIYEEDEYDAEIEAAVKLSEKHIFGILGVDGGTKTFTVNGSSASEFVAGEVLYVLDSTGNDGTYTIVSSEDGVDNTTVVVSEDIADSTVDGNIILRNI